MNAQEVQARIAEMVATGLSVEEATKLAYNLSEENDVILLSPACASWDQYEKFEDRGDDFKRVVEQLK